MDRFVVISGCSGGGKSSVLRELARRGHATIDEPGRRIIAQARDGMQHALPWIDPAAFAATAIAMAREDRARAADMPGTIFFDRGLVDAAVALEHATGKPVLQDYAAERYHARIFMTPPWPEIYVRDAERRHGLGEAVAEYERLLAGFTALGYATCVLPRIAVERRADLILETLKPA